MDNAVAGGFGLISARKTLYKRKILLELIRRGVGWSLSSPGQDTVLTGLSMAVILLRRYFGFDSPEWHFSLYAANLQHCDYSEEFSCQVLS